MIANSKPIGRVWSCVAATLLLAFAVTGLTDAANVAPGDEPPGAKNTVPKVPAETKKDAGSTVQPQAPKGREGAQPSPKRVAELIAVLRAAKYGDAIGESRDDALGTRHPRPRRDRAPDGACAYRGTRPYD